MKQPNVEAIKVYHRIEEEYQRCMDSYLKYEYFKEVSESYYKEAKVYGFILNKLKDIL